MLYSMEIICCKTVRHMPNARATSPDGYSECGYTKATSDTCTSFKENTESLYLPGLLISDSTLGWLM